MGTGYMDYMRLMDHDRATSGFIDRGSGRQDSPHLVDLLLLSHQRAGYATPDLVLIVPEIVPVSRAIDGLRQAAYENLLSLPYVLPRSSASRNGTSDVHAQQVGPQQVFAAAGFVARMKALIMRPSICARVFSSESPAV